MNSKGVYDKHAEHQDRSSLGRLRCKYWTTKQLVMKKLGREEDEFVIASDADVDAKLELLSTIKQSCEDLLRIMNQYQNNVLFLSHEETDMARFLKDYAQTDKTQAGKMMASVSKVLAYTAHQRVGLRQPLTRLYNEIETFRHRAVTDTMSTVKRMETARTEYRGSILWLKDASVELDPEKHLEKFRRVQSQVKTTKLEYDRLKFDVIQKIDLLTASRCNMYSHVLAAYQKSLLVFWEKTSKTMSSVAESFKGYQYYEFTVVKDLAEPSRLLAEKEKDKDKDKPLEMSDAQLDDQLIELEKLTSINPTSSTASAASVAGRSTIDETLIELSNPEYDQLLADLTPAAPPPVSSTDLLQMGNNEEKSHQFLPSSFLTDLLGSMNKSVAQTSPPAQPPPTTNNKPKSNWLDLFAELDPLQNPDAIGKTAADEADRSC